MKTLARAILFVFFSLIAILASGCTFTMGGGLGRP